MNVRALERAGPSTWRSSSGFGHSATLRNVLEDTGDPDVPGATHDWEVWVKNRTPERKISGAMRRMTPPCSTWWINNKTSLAFPKLRSRPKMILLRMRNNSNNDEDDALILSVLEVEDVILIFVVLQRLPPLTYYCLQRIPFNASRAWFKLVG